jgi:hypothetical protein
MLQTPGIVALMSLTPGTAGEEAMTRDSILRSLLVNPKSVRDTLSRYEQGNSEIGAAVLLRLARASGKTIEWLLTGRDRV